MILVTRPLSQVDKLQVLFKEANLEYALFPAFEIKKLLPRIPAQSYDIIIFISVNAVIYAYEFFPQLLSKDQQIFAIGPTTADKLMAIGVRVDAYPQENASSKALLELIKFQSITNKRVLIVRGDGGVETLKEALELFNQVDYLEVYERKKLSVSELHRQSIKRFMEDDKGVVLANSNQTLLNTFSLIESINLEYLDRLKQYPLIVISERIRTYARSLGFKKVHIAPCLGDNEALNEFIISKID